MIAVLLALALSSGDRPPPVALHHKRATAAACSQSVECAIQSGDKAGNWWALKADGTMLSSSALTMSAQGSPIVSPLTFNGTTQFYSAASIAFPSTSQSFSIVAVYRIASTAGNPYMVAKLPGGASNTFGVRLVTGRPALQVFQAGTPTQLVHSQTSSTNTWLGMSATYNNSGPTMLVRYSGSSTTESQGAPGVIGSTSAETDVAGATGAASFTGNLRGVFYTEKILSDSDVDRIIAGAM